MEQKKTSEFRNPTNQTKINHIAACLHYRTQKKKGKEKRWTALWGQGITHHIKLRLRLETLLSPGGHEKRWGGHLVWAQTFIYYLLLRSKDKGNEDDCPVTAWKQMNQTDLTELFTCCSSSFTGHTGNQHRTFCVTETEEPPYMADHTGLNAAYLALCLAPPAKNTDLQFVLYLDHNFNGDKNCSLIANPWRVMWPSGIVTLPFVTSRKVDFFLQKKTRKTIQRKLQCGFCGENC